MPRKLSTYLKAEYGEKIYRLSLSSGCTCPNRDGSIKLPDGTPLTGGCTFCSEGGSGDFATEVAPIDEQIEKAKLVICKKTDAKRFIAYFQSFTNTYGDLSRLEELYTKAIQRDDIEILSIGTRPDCINDEVIAMLKRLNSIKSVWIELGLQTINEESALRFHRGYELKVFDDAYKRLKDAGIDVIIHVIFGLPFETEEDMLGTIRYLSLLDPGIDGIKIQNLQVLKGTKLFEEFEEKPFHVLGLEEYTELVKKSLELLPESVVVHRITGDGPKRILVEPKWSADKKRVMNYMNKELKDILI